MLRDSRIVNLTLPNAHTPCLAVRLTTYTGTEQQLGLVAAERNELTAQLAALTATAAGGNSAAPGSGGEGSAQLMAMEMLRSEVTQHRRAAAAAETAQSAADSAAAELRVQVLRMQQEAASLKVCRGSDAVSQVSLFSFQSWTRLHGVV